MSARACSNCCWGWPTCEKTRDARTPPRFPNVHTNDPFAVPEQRFKAEMPHIPGVNEGAHSASSSPLRLILVAAAVVAVLGGAAWHTLHTAKQSVAVNDEAAPVEAP